MGKQLVAMLFKNSTANGVFMGAVSQRDGVLISETISE
jgi:hypothetical protein